MQVQSTYSQNGLPKPIAHQHRKKSILFPEKQKNASQEVKIYPEKKIYIYREIKSISREIKKNSRETKNFTREIKNIPREIEKIFSRT